MKKILFLMALCAVVIQLKAQTTWSFLDGAVTGTGLNQFNYVGAGWVLGTNSTDPYRDATVSFSNQTGNYVTCTFYGKQISFFTAKASHHGIVAVSIDNGAETMVDLYASTRVSYFEAYTSPQLTEGNHTLKIRVTGTKNASSTNTYGIVDYVTITKNSNLAFGALALRSLTTGTYNTAAGIEALQANTIGYENTGVGFQSLYSTTGSLVPLTGSIVRGSRNTAVGYQSLFANKDGHSNIAIGGSSLRENTSGGENVGVGIWALTTNVSGSLNTAIGTASMASNLTGSQNTAVGANALRGGTGSHNAAMGYLSLGFNEGGSNNISIGSFSMRTNTEGQGNVAVGNYALYSNQVGNYNTAIGYEAGYSMTQTPISNSTAIGSGAAATGSNQVRLGNAEVTSIGGLVSWSTLSDGRVKKDVKEDVSGLAFIEKLRPVSYVVDVNEVNKLLRIPDSLQNKTASRQKPVRQIGFVAQEVEAVVKKTGYTFSGVEAPQSESDHYSIRYSEFVVPLVKAMQELSATVKDQKDEITQLKKQVQSYDSLLGIQGNSDNKVTAVLYQNSPNPFSVNTEIKITLPDDAMNAVVKIYNLEGKQLKSVLVKERGTAKINVSANELNAGMYLYTLIVDGKMIDTKRMILTE